MKKSNYDFIEAFFLASVLFCLIEMVTHSLIQSLKCCRMRSQLVRLSSHESKRDMDDVNESESDSITMLWNFQTIIHDIFISFFL